MSLLSNPCLNCGACCACFRVDFASEELSSQGGHVPDGLAVDLLPGLMRLRGTDHAQPRCAALMGKVGEHTTCGIYEWRPSPCREFSAGEPACHQARRRYGLLPL
jgi:Fe-S-cluster containining protein